jgi:hypothetical protein
MAKIAVDVVLLPSQEMSDRAIEANRKLLKQRAGGITLDKESCLPHVSLAMGGMDERDTANNYAPGPLTVMGVHTETDLAGEEISMFLIKKTRRLQSLHEAVMRRLSRHFSYDVTADMVLYPPAASPSTLAWINDYPEKSSFENFFPHITIGYGRVDKFPFPVEFSASQLALCHLGNFCTCRKVLATTELRR